MLRFSVNSNRVYSLSHDLGLFNLWGAVCVIILIIKKNVTLRKDSANRMQKAKLA